MASTISSTATPMMPAATIMRIMSSIRVRSLFMDGMRKALLGVSFFCISLLSMAGG